MWGSAEGEGGGRVGGEAKEWEEGSGSGRGGM